MSLMFFFQMFVKVSNGNLIEVTPNQRSHKNRNRSSRSSRSSQFAG
jgi:hypothetical protein